MSCHPSQEAERALGRAPHTVDCQTHCLQFPEMEMWRPHREARTSDYTWAVPAQVSPRAAQCWSHNPPEAQQEYLPSQIFLQLMILFGKHCCLLLSSPFELNILVITGEIRIIALTKDNMDKFNKSGNKKCK